MRGQGFVVEGYKTKEAAQQQKERMRGWNTKVIEAWPYPGRMGSGERYAIQCNGNGYLCTDGYVHTL